MAEVNTLERVNHARAWFDPAAVVKELWIWAGPGQYYRIPLINFGGLFLTGFIYFTVFYRARVPKSLQHLQHLFLCWLVVRAAIT